MTLQKFLPTWMALRLAFVVGVMSVLPLAAYSQSTAELIARAKASIEKQQYDGAVADLTAAISAEPQNGLAYAQRARAHHLADRNVEALADAEKALSLDPRILDALNIRGRIKNINKDSDGAIADFTAALAIDSKFAKALLNRSSVYAARGDIEKALADLTNVISVDPKNEAALQSRAQVLMDKKDYAASVVDLNKLLQLSPRSRSALALRGQAYQKLNKLDESIADLSAAIAIDPKLEFAFAARGISHYLRSEYDLALADFARATELDPKQYGVTINAGLTYIQQKKYDLALAEYAKVPADSQYFEQAKTLIADAVTAKAKKAFDPAATVALTSYANSNDLAGVVAALQKGADPNGTFVYYDNKNSTALQRAAFHGNVEMARALLAAGADANLADANGSSPLSFAVYKYATTKSTGNLEVVRLLLKSRANPNSKDRFGETPIYSPLMYPNGDLVALLIAAGADMNARSNAQVTPLIRAGQYDTSPATLQAMIAAKADLDAVDVNKYSALSNSIRKGPFGLARSFVLVSSGASIDNLPDDLDRNELSAAIAFIKLVKELDHNSAEFQILSAAVYASKDRLDANLARSPATDKTILTFAAVIAAVMDRPDMLASLAKSGASMTKGIDSASLEKIAERRPDALAFIRGYTGIVTVEPPIDPSQTPEGKLAALIENAAMLVKAANVDLARGLARKQEGADKGLWCTHVRRAAETLRLVDADLQQADKLFVPQFAAQLKAIKEGHIAMKRQLADQGCN